MVFGSTFLSLIVLLPIQAFTPNDENIGNHGYISTWILQIYRIYQRYIDGYFDTKYRYIKN